jgi:uncharacterized protein YbaP (TraB family)
MTKKIILTLSLFYFISLISLGASPKQKATPPPQTLLWEVCSMNDTNKVMYLLGSIHLATKDMYPLNPIIMEAFNKSNVLGVEMDIENFDMTTMSNDISLISKIVSFSDKLSSKLPPELYNKVANKLSELEIPDGIVDYLTPLGAALVIEMGETIRAMSDENDDDNNIVDGIDKYFLKLAKSEEKEIIEVESLKRQMEVLDGLNEFIFDYINSLLDNEKSIDNEDNNIFEAYKKGDIETINKLINAPFSKDPKIDMKLKDILLFKRNEEMAKKLEGYFNENKTFFIVLGVGHFIGNRSVIENLEKTKKYKIVRK